MSCPRRLAPSALVLALAALLACTLPGAARGADWQLFPLPVPSGGQFATPPGLPGDLAFWAPNRGLMTVTGNASVQSGIYSWDGAAWHQLATVCGPFSTSDGDGAIAWAGPTEFWTIARVSPGVLGASGSLCRFKDGAVVGSYAAPNVPSYQQRLSTAACVTPDDCWFGGAQGASADGSQIGAFHLRWNGRGLAPQFGPQGRAVSDLQAHRGRLFESVRVGAAHFGRDAPVLREPEAVPALLHTIDGATIANDRWAPAPLPDTPADGTELLSLDSDGTTAWAVGGTATTGPSADSGVRRPPIAVRHDGEQWSELTLSGAGIGGDEVFTEVAAIPGTHAAWAVLRKDPQTPATSAQPRIAHIAADGAVTVHQLGDSRTDPARGDALHVACPAADDCWLATARGYLFRWGGRPYEIDADPAFQGTISQRPNEGAAQFLPDTPPADDSRLHAPPVEVPPIDDELPATCGRPPRLMTGVRDPRRTLLPGQKRAAPDPRYRLTVGFRLNRRARVALIAERAGGPRGRRGRARVIARTRVQTLGRGRRQLSVTVRRSTWPTRLRFALRETGRVGCAATTSTRTTASR